MQNVRTKDSRFTRNPFHHRKPNWKEKSPRESLRMEDSCPLPTQLLHHKGWCERYSNPEDAEMPFCLNFLHRQLREGSNSRLLHLTGATLSATLWLQIPTHRRLALLWGDRFCSVWGPHPSAFKWHAVNGYPLSGQPRCNGDCMHFLPCIGDLKPLSIPRTYRFPSFDGNAGKRIRKRVSRERGGHRSLNTEENKLTWNSQSYSNLTCWSLLTYSS